MTSYERPILCETRDVESKLENKTGKVTISWLARNCIGIPKKTMVRSLTDPTVNHWRFQTNLLYQYRTQFKYPNVGFVIFLYQYQNFIFVLYRNWYQTKTETKTSTEKHLKNKCLFKCKNVLLPQTKTIEMFHAFGPLFKNTLQKLTLPSKV